MAFFTQAMWQMSHGHQFVSLFDKNFFANHSNFIALLVLPIFKIIPHPLTLVFLKILSFSAAGYLLYVLAKDKLSQGLSIILMILYFFYLPNMYGLLYEFDFESLSPLFLFLLYLFYTRKRLLPFYLCCLALISIKENMPLIVAAFGFFALFQKGQEKIKWGIIPVLVGGISFCLLTMVIIPRMGGNSSHPYLAHYAAIKANSVLDIGARFLTKPIVILNALLEKQNLRFLLSIFKPLAFLPLLAPSTIFIVFPIFLQHLLSSTIQEKTIFFYYVLPIAPFLFISMISSLALLKRKTRKWLFPLIIFGLIVICSIDISKHKDKFIPKILGTTAQRSFNQKKWEMVRKIAPNKSIVATFNFLPALSSIKDLYSFHIFLNPARYYQSYKLFIKGNIDYALIDFNDLGLYRRLTVNPKMLSLRIRDLIRKNNWSAIDFAGNVVLFGKTEGPPKKIVEIFPKFSLGKEDGPSISLDKFSVKISTSFQEQNILFDFNWASTTEKISGNYQMLFIVKKEGLPILYQRRLIGYGIYPTSCWEKGDYIKESYNMILPALKSGKYTVEAYIFNPNDLQTLDVNHSVDILNQQHVTLASFSVSNTGKYE
ncbi:MAG: DUF2079 domain-containing protein [Candidatus Omnitrophica bacterium]|nr:DUF2079 domain-containing protein [Candidatus Omnitrophota bacterium]